MKKTILEEMYPYYQVKYLQISSNSVCKIIIDSENEANGFFIKIKKNKLIYKFLIIYHNLLKDLIDSKKDVEILLKDGKKYNIAMDNEKRVVEFREELDIIIIGLLDEDLFIKEIDFLFCDLNYIDGYNKYKNKDVLIIKISKDNSYSEYIHGKIKSINLEEKNFEISSSYYKNEEFLGSPIILIENNKVIGIQIKNNEKNNYGMFIGELINIINNINTNELKAYVKIGQLIKFSKSFCIIQEIEYIGFFLNFGKKNFLCVNFNIDNSGFYSFKLANGKNFTIKLDKFQRLVKQIDKLIFIEILETDEVKKDIEFLKVDLNYIDRDEYFEKNIIILAITKNYGMKLGIEKFKNLVLYENQIGDYEKQFENSEKIFCSFPIVSLDNFRVLGMLYEGNLIANQYRGILLKEIEYELMNDKPFVSISPKLDYIFITKATKSVCKIRDILFSEFDRDREYKNGFFMKISKENKLLYFLITHKIAIPKAIKYWDSFKIVLANGEEKHIKMIKKDNSKRNYYDEDGTVAVEITDDDEIKDKVEFLECDLNMENDNFTGKNIFTVFYALDGNAKISSGTIVKDNPNNRNNRFEYLIDSYKNSFGSPILLVDSLKVIGIHSCYSYYYNNSFIAIWKIIKEILNGRSYANIIIISPDDPEGYREKLIRLP